MWLVEYYETVDGEKPAYDFINSLSVKMRAKAAWEMTILSEMGTQIQKPYSKPIRDGIFELRIQAEGNGARVFYFFMIGKRIIVTNGFIKKTRATPQREIALALKYKKDYIRRNGYEK
ncbi:MAG: type II toxin-antitoxin system RelE/ParE family toxin [Clostridiales Family XIII bacterium]|nr:type II toxin-antitoxin system RelE/ParE family toxin [Clostridiales Family XIII bacterium]